MKRDHPLRNQSGCEPISESPASKSGSRAGTAAASICWAADYAFSEDCLTLRERPLVQIAMPAFTPLRKAMVVIAVSNYGPPYEALPGTLTSARRIANWARQPGDGRNYKVIEITDEPVAGQPGRAVTVDRLRAEITELLDNNIIDRLVVYFAGHGVVRSMAEEFWLLTHAGRDDGECVGVMQFVHGLRNYGIGAHNPELLRGQLVVFADACRDVHRDGLNFAPSALMTRSGTAPSLHVDLFRSTTVGAYSFQVKAVDGAEPYCLFSSVLCDALEGKVPEVIEREHHAFKPVISNHTLADYLDREVPKRAAVLKESMEPDSHPTIRPDHNYYDILRPRPEARQQQQQQQGGTIPLPPDVAEAVLLHLGIAESVVDALPLQVPLLNDGVVRRAFEKALDTGFPEAIGPTPPIELPNGQLLPGRNSTGHPAARRFRLAESPLRHRRISSVPGRKDRSLSIVSRCCEGDGNRQRVPAPRRADTAHAF